MHNNTKMRIGYIGIKGLPSKAGADRVVEAIVQRLADKHELTVYCSALVVPPNARYPGVELVRVSTLRGKHLHAISLFLMSAIHSLTRKFDLVHLHNIEASYVLPILKMKFKVIATLHGAYGVPKKWGRAAKLIFRFAKWPVRMADCITNVSQSQIAYNERQFSRKVKFIPNGVDPRETDIDQSSSLELLKSYDVEANNYILFAAGRVIPIKGASTLLEAYRILQSDRKLLIVGDASHVSTYEKELHQAADSRVVFIPFVDKSILLGLFRLTSFLVFPSTLEGMSMVLLEAASQATPIISSDIPENKTILPQQALFFRTGDARDLLSKMNWAIQNPDKMQELGTSAQTWVMEHYNWDSIIPQYDQIYQNVAGKNQKTGN